MIYCFPLFIDHIINFQVVQHPEPNNDSKGSFKLPPDTTDDIPPPVPDAPPSNDIHKDEYAVSRIKSHHSHRSHRSHRSHSSQHTVRFADEMSSPDSKSNSKKSKKSSRDSKPAVPEVPQKPKTLSSTQSRRSKEKSSRSIEEQQLVPPEVPDPPPGGYDDIDTHPRGRKRKAGDKKEKGDVKKSKSRTKDGLRLLSAPISIPSDLIPEKEEPIPTENKGVEPVQESQEASDTVQSLSGKIHDP